MSLLDDLDLNLDGPALVETGLEPVEQWVGSPALQPVPMLVGDWYARALDAGLPYDLLVETSNRFAVHQAPPSADPSPARTRGRTRRPGVVSPETPLHTLIALARADDESDREHLLRLGRQVRVFDLPNARAFFGLARHRSTFDDCDLAAADLAALTGSPLTVDRLVLTTRESTDSETLDVLSRDAATGVRIGVASHPNVSAAAAVRLLVDDSTDVYAAAVTNPAVDFMAKGTAIEGRGLSPAVEAAILSIAATSKGSASRRHAVTRQ